MRETICTIPVNEIFEVVDGCPICRMRDLIEAKYIDYITGAAMMEPDIRVMTNEKGFCERHFTMMLELGRQRLPICLTVSTHLGHIEKKLLCSPDAKSLKKLEQVEDTCFVCEAIENHLARALDTVYRTYKTEEEFRALFAAQEHLCLPHYRRLLTEGKRTVGGKYAEFSAKALELAKNRALRLKDELKGFEDAFDHRNAGKPMPESSRDSIERTIEFITSRKPRVKGKNKGIVQRSEITLPERYGSH